MMTHASRVIGYYIAMLVVDNILREVMLRAHRYTPPERQLPATAGRTTALAWGYRGRCLISFEGPGLGGTQPCELEVSYVR
jgi:hypothetical protein